MTRQFTAQRSCKIRGHKFKAEDIISVEFPSAEYADWFELECIGKGGPWGYGGFTSRDILDIADSITETGRDEEIFDSRERVREYYLVYNTGADDYSVGPFTSSLLARAFGYLEMNDSEGEGQGEFIIVPRSRVTAGDLRSAQRPSDAVRSEDEGYAQ